MTSGKNTNPFGDGKGGDGKGNNASDGVEYPADMGESGVDEDSIPEGGTDVLEDEDDFHADGVDGINPPTPFKKLK